MKSSAEQNNSWWKRLGWLILIWTAGVAVVTTAAYLLRLFMNAAGLIA